MDAVISEPAGKNLDNAFRKDVLHGFSLAQKAIPARWFYDRRGSELFEQITALPEYYPTRTEIEILRACAPDVARRAGAGRIVIEFGAGSATKTPLLLDSVDAHGYVPIDISGPFLRDSCKPLAQRYPALPIHPVEADFMDPVSLPVELPEDARLGFFPGSTIGNMEPQPAIDLLRAMRETLGDDGMLLIGMDRIKDPQILLDAYDDAAGVTAQFNLNLIHRINRELGGTIPVAAFRHKAVWNAGRARIEMYLEAERDVAFAVAGQPFSMHAGESIHTENSHKYDDVSADRMLRAGGWEPVARYGDDAALFMVILARAASPE